jgi:hypothetical protein
VNIVILCRRPGMIRAGVSHPGVAVHAPGAFTADQMLELIAEPEITVVIGEVLSAEGVAALFAKPAADAKGKKTA